jgi:hypothetical protein
MVNVIGTRVIDMSLVLDGLGEIEQQVPNLAGKIIHANYIAAGHSIGTLIAMRVTGLVVHEVITDQTIGSNETRFNYLVLLSDPGKMRNMPLSAWTGSKVPTFMSTGTEDYGLMGARGEPEDGNTILSSDTTVDRYQLLLQDGDHYFGGLVQKEVETEPDYEGLELFNENSTAFMDAYVKGNKSALNYLNSVDMQTATNSRAELIREPAQN